MASPPSQSVQHGAPSTPQPSLPRAPDPSTDPGTAPSMASAPTPDGTLPQQELDIFVLAPEAAMKMLCRNVDTMVKLTGNIPPTPPPPIDKDLQAQVTRSGNSADNPAKEKTGFATSDTRAVPHAAIGSPEDHQDETVNLVEAQVGRANVQQILIARKFYSKKPPGISTEEYLLRMHKYCPMSTAVYLATSLYITRLAMVERVVAVTPRNVHRLLLAGLRVAMKALEDLSYPHSRFANVGGVSETELGRLEVSFCFLANFELKVSSEMLQTEYMASHERALRKDEAPFNLVLPKGEKKKVSSGLTTVSVSVPVETPS